MKPLRVLLVEDEVLIAMLLIQVLEEMGHDVCATESTEFFAVAAAARCRPDMIIADARLRREAASRPWRNPPYGARAARVRQWRCFRC